MTKDKNYFFRVHSNLGGLGLKGYKEGDKLVLLVKKSDYIDKDSLEEGMVVGFKKLGNLPEKLDVSSVLTAADTEDQQTAKALIVSKLNEIIEYLK